MHRNWQSLIKPKRLEPEEETLTDVYGRFVAEPLERGFGNTIGNSLRRILLSAIQGAAVTAVRIKGVLHEFSTVPGVREDVTDIILNLKELRLKLFSEGPESIRIKAKDAGEIKAGDIITTNNVEILNPELHIATLSKDGELDMEMVVKHGKGYIPAEGNKDDMQPVGTIPIDAIFSPIKRVNYKITHARVGQVTDYDRLSLEVWTDGSLGPDDAIAYAARILQDQLTIFINFEEEPIAMGPEPVEDKPKFNENLYRSIEELELSVRSSNCLKNANIKQIWELVQRSETEMLKTKNFGRKSLNEIKEILTEMGLSLGTKLENFPPAMEKDREDDKKKTKKK